MSVRRITVVTTSRADWSHLYWPLHELRRHPAVELHLLATAAHLAPGFGATVDEIERDGFRVHRVESLLHSDTDLGMAKTLGLSILGLADALAGLRPDLLLLIADRYEMLAPAAVALTLRIPIAHIEGGEISEGAIDNQVRNAITKMAHIHFTSTALARERVIAMGEDPARVHQAGAPSLDHLRRSPLPTRAELEEALGFGLAKPPIVVAYHPVTLLRDTTGEAEEVFAALERMAEADGERPLVLCLPNADAGSHGLMARVRALCAAHGQARLYANLRAPVYWALLREAALVVGNSSSGIMEAASLGLPAVDIGFRQRGRERGPNVVNAAPERGAILAAMERALSPQFRVAVQGVPNLYGDGHAAERIARVLTETPLDGLLHKR